MGSRSYRGGLTCYADDKYAFLYTLVAYIVLVKGLATASEFSAFESLTPPRVACRHSRAPLSKRSCFLTPSESPAHDVQYMGCPSSSATADWRSLVRLLASHGRSAWVFIHLALSSLVTLAVVWYRDWGFWVTQSSCPLGGLFLLLYLPLLYNTDRLVLDKPSFTCEANTPSFARPSTHGRFQGLWSLHMYLWGMPVACISGYR